SGRSGRRATATRRRGRTPSGTSSCRRRSEPRCGPRCSAACPPATRPSSSATSASWSGRGATSEPTDVRSGRAQGQSLLSPAAAFVHLRRSLRRRAVGLQLRQVLSVLLLELVGRLADQLAEGGQRVGVALQGGDVVVQLLRPQQPLLE